MNQFLNSLKNGVTYTENGALTLQSTNSKVLDFFSRAGAMRGRGEDALRLFFSALDENPLLAMKALFWLRDIRGGSGERDLFRHIVTRLAATNPSVIAKNISLFAEYGRWDDLWGLLNTPLHNDAIALVKATLTKDLESLENGGKVSLLAKWLPSENAGKASRVMSHVFMLNLGLMPWQYRKMLSMLRKAIGIVESQMSSGNWGKIKYDGVPSRAAMIYRKAFGKHDGERYAQYLEDVKSGKSTIKAATLYPYDIVHRVFEGRYDATLEAQWKALPDYLAENPHNGIVVCDVSGSMNGQPKEVAISLAMYTAERNNGAFRDHFITFSRQPQLQKVVGSSLRDRVINLDRAEWDMDTNLQAVFDLILSHARRFNVPESDMPDVVYIVSDMEFNAACRNTATNFEYIAKQYKNAGYQLPALVFWNVNARSGQSPVSMHETGTTLVSGFSPAIFTSLLAGGVDGLRNLTPYTLMLQVLNGKRYEVVAV